MVSRSVSVEERQRRFTALVDDNLFNQLWRQAARLTRCREDAEDLLQETLTAAFQKFDQLRDPNKLRPWLMAILRRRFFNHVRLVRRRLRGLEELRVMPVAENEGPDGEVAAVALGLLPPDQHWLLTMYYIEELSTAEISTVLGITNANVRQRLHRARTALEDKLRDVMAESVTEVA
jgi:RNA polymerase sigma-70 factor (ECF subfamily)